jgi:hypothetical protein
MNRVWIWTNFKSEQNFKVWTKFKCEWILNLNTSCTNYLLPWHHINWKFLLLVWNLSSWMIDTAMFSFCFQFKTLFIYIDVYTYVMWWEMRYGGLIYRDFFLWTFFDVYMIYRCFLLRGHRSSSLEIC